MEFLHRTVEWAPVILAVLGCALAWWFWPRQKQSAGIARWRRVAGTSALILVSASILSGAFAWIYWVESTEPGPGPPRPTFIATYLGLFLVMLAISALLCAKGRIRAMLALSSIGLFGFYFLMFLSP